MNKRRTIFSYGAGALLALTLFGGARPAAVQGKAPDDRAVAKDFEARISRYLDTHKQAGIDNKPSASAEKLDRQKKEVAQSVRRLRPDARQGEIFTPAIGVYLKRQIAAVLHGAEGGKVRSSLRHAEPLPNVELKVNEAYPDKLPLQSTPPSLLAQLPPLPKELQYRIVGQTLVLVDVSSKLVVDLLPDAIPAGNK